MPKYRAHHRVQEDAVPESRHVWWCENKSDCAMVLGVVRNGELHLLPGSAVRVCANVVGVLMVQCAWCTHWATWKPQRLRDAG